ncbi:MAG: hypothetical protein KUG83_07260 [Gammaproteobacteria bacterium]|nr:hypothetical protein [Gammaproteobacteria bacterium]
MPTIAKKLRLAFLCSIISAPLLAGDINQMSPARELEVTVVTGKELPKLLNKASEPYSLMAVSDGQLLPIPFQFDDVSLKGLVHVPNGKVPVKGKVGIIEENDQLAFMYKDMGTKANPEQLAAMEGTLISELEINEDGTQRYAYIVEGNTQRSKKVYTYYDFETGLVETEYFSLQVSTDNILVWSDWKIKGFNGVETATNILDTMKVRVKARMGFIKATLHNSLIPVHTYAVKNGPVRSIVEADASLSILGIDLASGGVTVTYTAQTIEYPLFFLFPKAGEVLSSLILNVTLDFIDFDGSRYRTALGPKEPLITGTKESEDIRDQYKVDLDHPWETISTGKNWDMFFFFERNNGFDPTLNAVYFDEKAGDKANKPERYKGSHSEFGPSLSDLPFGSEGILGFNLYFGPDLWQGNNPEKAADQITNPAIVIVH